MMKHFRGIVSALLAVLLLSLPVFASTGFHAGLSVDRETEGQITVVVRDSSVLADNVPTLSIPCDYEYAEVSGPDGAVDCTIADGYVSFPVAKGGTYVITETDAPAGEGGDGGTPAPAPGVLPPQGGETDTSADGESEAAEPSEELWSNPFTDVDRDAWYYDCVAEVNQKGLMNGMGDGTVFAPRETTTRAMVMTILARLSGVDTDTGAVWYEAGLNWAVDAGITDGTSPAEDITREQLAAMLYRHAGCPPVDGALVDYPDGDSVSVWAVDAMLWAVHSGILQGDGNRMLSPGNTASRAELAAVLARYMSK